ncbi:MAG: hypothetical protein MUP13_05170 [Thermoanaerobaculales bacterium]|nr:hypothetical protein [Thermoanaerobaculales bacterium]
MTDDQQPTGAAAPDPEPEQPAGSGLSITVAIGILLLVLFAIFAVQNTQKLEVEFLAWTFQTSRITKLLVTAGIFVVLDEIAGYLWRRRRRQRKVAKALRRG